MNTDTDFFSPEMTLFLVRHGEATHNVARILSSVVGNNPHRLTDHGKKQATEAGKKIASEGGADMIISSPLLRTKETSELIGKEIGVTEILIDDRLHETTFGKYEGKSIQKFFEKYPTPDTRIQTDGSDGVESFEQERNRVAEFLADLKMHYPGKRVVLVSHADPLEQLHGLIVGESIFEASTGWHPETGSVTKLNY